MRRVTQQPLDLAIDVEGYFIVQTPAGGFLFTRHGDFSVSSSGELANGDGYVVHPTIVAAASAAGGMSVTTNGVVQVTAADGATTPLGQFVIARFAHADRLERDGPYYLPTAGSGDPIPGRPGTNGLGTLRIGELED